MASLRPPLEGDEWDKQMKADAETGKFDAMSRVLTEHEAGHTEEWLKRHQLSNEELERVRELKKEDDERFRQSHELIDELMRHEPPCEPERPLILSQPPTAEELVCLRREAEDSGKVTDTWSEEDLIDYIKFKRRGDAALDRAAARVNAAAAEARRRGVPLHDLIPVH